MEQEILDKINRRLEALDVVHTRYRGEKGQKGDRGEAGPPGRDGKDSTVVEVNALKAERNAFREELNNFRSELHDLRAMACTELRQLYDEYAAQLADVYDKETGAFCKSLRALGPCLEPSYLNHLSCRGVVQPLAADLLEPLKTFQAIDGKPRAVSFHERIVVGIKVNRKLRELSRPLIRATESLSIRFTSSTVSPYFAFSRRASLSSISAHDLSR